MSHFPALCLSYVTDGDRCSGLRLQSPEQIWYFDTLFCHNCLHSTIHTCSPASAVEDVHVRVCMRMFKSSCLTVLCHQYCEKDWSTLVWHLSLYASFACLCRGCSSLVFPLFELADGPKCVRDETTLDPRAKWARLFPVFREKRARKKAFRAHRGTAALAYTHTHSRRLFCGHDSLFMLYVLSPVTSLTLAFRFSWGVTWYMLHKLNSTLWSHCVHTKRCTRSAQIFAVRAQRSRYLVA